MTRNEDHNDYISCDLSWHLSEDALNYIDDGMSKIEVKLSLKDIK